MCLSDRNRLKEMRKLLFTLSALAALACSGDAVERQAAEAACSYYNRMLEGYPDGMAAAQEGVGDQPDDYRRQLEAAFGIYADDMVQKHGGLRAVSISPNIGRRDSLPTAHGAFEHIVYAFLLLSFNDSTQEEIAVPMVQRDGEWFIK